ncbi:DnaA ATPase domain-containing protein [Celeribacter arenosi]|uniref:DnaA/Hda family protein n=1 Tax=Celeribacter arenosi TaxID=792649 RepID=A0ABP7JSI7_9RHOB
MAEQLPLDLPSRAALGRDAFFVSPSNAIAIATLDNHANWPSGKLALVGPESAGKTHLAHVWAAECDAVILPVRDLAGADIPAVAAKRYVCVEDADTLARAPNAAALEEAFFHLHNLTLAEAGRLLVTATTPPRDWNLRLPDLASRMEGTAVVRIAPPDDQLLAALLVKLFDDRQIAAPETLIPYLVKRIERSARAAQEIVENLDRAALACGKPVSRALAAKLLDGDSET